jgi:hypothetical protein
MLTKGMLAAEEDLAAAFVTRDEEISENSGLIAALQADHVRYICELEDQHGVDLSNLSSEWQQQLLAAQTSHRDRHDHHAKELSRLQASVASESAAGHRSSSHVDFVHPIMTLSSEDVDAFSAREDCDAAALLDASLSDQAEELKNEWEEKIAELQVAHVVAFNAVVMEHQSEMERVVEQLHGTHAAALAAVVSPWETKLVEVEAAGQSALAAAIAEYDTGLAAERIHKTTAQFRAGESLAPEARHLVSIDGCKSTDLAVRLSAAVNGRPGSGTWYGQVEEIGKKLCMSESHAPDLPMSMAGIEQKNSEQKSLPRTPIGHGYDRGQQNTAYGDSEHVPTSITRSEERIASASPTSSEIAAEETPVARSTTKPSNHTDSMLWATPERIASASPTSSEIAAEIAEGMDTATLQSQAEEAFGARRFGDAVTLLAVAAGREPESAELADGLAFAEQVRGSI